MSFDEEGEGYNLQEVNNYKLLSRRRSRFTRGCRRAGYLEA